MRRLWKRTITVVLLLLAIYSLAGFLLVPGIVLQVANQQLAQHATLPARLARVEFNPFTFTLALYDLSLGAPGEPELQVRRGYVDFQLDSLWQGQLHLSRLELDVREARWTIAADGTHNVLQWFLSAPAPEDVAETGAAPFPLAIDQLHLEGRRIRFEDHRQPATVTRKLSSLDLRLEQLTTHTSQPAHGYLAATTVNGEQLHWDGHLELSARRSHGHLNLDQLDLATFAPYLRQALPLQLTGGKASLQATYQTDLADEISLRIDDATLALDDLAVDHPDGTPMARLARFKTEGARLDSRRREASIGALEAQRLQAWGKRDKHGRMDLTQLLPAADEPSPPATWRLRLDSALLEDGRLHLRDELPPTPVMLDLTSVRLAIEHFDSLADHPFDLHFAATAGQGRIEGAGSLAPAGTSGTLQLSLADIDLRLAQPYLTPFAHLDIRSGRLGADVAIELSAPFSLALAGNASVSQLHLRDTLHGRDLARWKGLSLDGIDYHHSERLGVAQARISQPYLRLVINPDLSSNFSELRVRRNNTGTTTSEPFSIRIGEVLFEDGSASFADFSLRPPFVTAAHDLNGRIGTLDNRQTKPAGVQLEGKVDRYAPVSLDGTLTPFDPLQSLDIVTRFRQLELTTLSPYSAKFAGYRIRRGRLDLDLHYRIVAGRLAASNHVVIEQLQLGEQIDSPDAVDLPVRLAVALLKDSRGNIELKLPVEGDLNDPNFDVMPIVWQALRNLVARAATSPFRFIAGLTATGAGADLGHIDFDPASAALDAHARQALSTLGEALAKRPALRLDIEGTARESLDGRLLASARVEQDLQQAWAESSGEHRAGDRAAVAPPDIPLPVKAGLLQDMYRQRLQQAPPSDWDGLAAEDQAERLRQALINDWAARPALSRRLAQARAGAIRDYLIEHAGVSADRIFLVDVLLLPPGDGERITSRLHLDAR